jgi:hypothetical protein
MRKYNKLVGLGIAVGILCVCILSQIIQNPSRADGTGYLLKKNEKEYGLVSVFKLIQTYRSLHNGAYPGRHNGSLFVDVLKNLKAYGFENFHEAEAVLISPDNKNADKDSIAYKRPNSMVSYSFFDQRPDGAPIGAPLFRGENDVIATTAIYYYDNRIGSSKTGKLTINPSGYYLILRSDGQIDKIPYDMTILVPITQHEFIDAFPEQPGVSSESISYSEFYTINGGNVLIGKPTVKGNDTPIPDNGGPEGLITFSRLFNYPDVYGIDRARMWKILDPAQEEFTLDQMQSAAAKLGLSLQKKTISLDELQKLHTPAMLYLRDARRIVTMSTIDDNHAIIYDRGMTLNVSRAELAKRYGGEALIATSVNAPSSLTADQPIRTLDFSSKDAEVTQNVKITNHGAKPISLLIERPLCGITEAKLSQDNLAPGASANLELHFKWRDVLPGDHQSTFVTLKTDDSAEPRLQLGFDLKLAEGK